MVTSVAADPDAIAAAVCKAWQPGRGALWSDLERASRTIGVGLALADAEMCRGVVIALEQHETWSREETLSLEELSRTDAARPLADRLDALFGDLCALAQVRSRLMLERRHRNIGTQLGRDLVPVITVGYAALRRYTLRELTGPLAHEIGHVATLSVMRVLCISEVEDRFVRHYAGGLLSSARERLEAAQAAYADPSFRPAFDVCAAMRFQEEYLADDIACDLVGAETVLIGQQRRERLARDLGQLLPADDRLWPVPTHPPREERRRRIEARRAA